MTSPDFSLEHWVSVFSPIQSSENITFVLSNFSNSGTSFKYRSFVYLLGALSVMLVTGAALDKIYLIVGMPTILELSDIRPASSKGILKSTLTKLFF